MTGTIRLFVASYALMINARDWTAPDLHLAAQARDSQANVRTDGPDPFATRSIAVAVTFRKRRSLGVPDCTSESARGDLQRQGSAAAKSPRVFVIDASARPAGTSSDQAPVSRSPLQPEGGHVARRRRNRRPADRAPGTVTQIVFIDPAAVPSPAVPDEHGSLLDQARVFDEVMARLHAVSASLEQARMARELTFF